MQWFKFLSKHSLAYFTGKNDISKTRIHQDQKNCNKLTKIGCFKFHLATSADPHFSSSQEYSATFLGILLGDHVRQISLQSIMSQVEVAVSSTSNSAPLSSLHTLFSFEHSCTARRNLISAVYKAHAFSFLSAKHSELLVYNTVGTAIILQNPICLSSTGFFLIVLEIVLQFFKICLF